MSGIWQAVKEKHLTSFHQVQAVIYLRQNGDITVGQYNTILTDWGFNATERASMTDLYNQIGVLGAKTVDSILLLADWPGTTGFSSEAEMDARLGIS